MNKYSVVFMPDVQTITLVKEMKLNLAAKAGSFKSKNALAHFSIFEFFSEVSQEDRFFTQLERIASEIESFEIHCNSFNQYNNGAFYIKPSEDSTDKMSSIMKQILNEVTTMKKEHQTTTPHLTIGRQLSQKQLQIAQQMFQNIDISFPVTHLSLRKFNPQIKQYEVYKEFPLLGKPKEIQGSLF